jgi:GMP synthase-like glutamine amidotransferase
LYFQSNEGMIHKSRPIFSTQFHPEAKGGPLDSSYLFGSSGHHVLLANGRLNTHTLLGEQVNQQRTGTAVTLRVEARRILQ